MPTKGFAVAGAPRHGKDPMYACLMPQFRLRVVLLALGIGLTTGATGAAPSPLRQVSPFSDAAPGATIPEPWQRQSLPGVERQNTFELVADAGRTVLEVRSDAAASTLTHVLAVEPAQAPLLTWRWKVSRALKGSDFSRKSGDDYAARVYVLFDYPVEKLSLGDRVKMSLGRTLYGAELPTAAIAYVWGTAQKVGDTGPNPYTDRVQMIVVDSGAGQVGQWREIERDVAADFRAVFGVEAPRVVGIAVSADTDNTGEAVVTRFGDLRFLPR